MGFVLLSYVIFLMTSKEEKNNTYNRVTEDQFQCSQSEENFNYLDKYVMRLLATNDVVDN